jgi:hypothetical protein
VFGRAVDVRHCDDARLRVERGGFVFYDVVPAGVALDAAVEEAERARREAAEADAAAKAAEPAGGACPVRASDDDACVVAAAAAST